MIRDMRRLWRSQRDIAPPVQGNFEPPVHDPNSFEQSSGYRPVLTSATRATRFTVDTTSFSRDGANIMLTYDLFVRHTRQHEYNMKTVLLLCDDNDLGAK